MPSTSPESADPQAALAESVSTKAVRIVASQSTGHVSGPTYPGILICGNGSGSSCLGDRCVRLADKWHSLPSSYISARLQQFCSIPERLPCFGGCQGAAKHPKGHDWGHDSVSYSLPACTGLPTSSRFEALAAFLGLRAEGFALATGFCVATCSALERQGQPDALSGAV